jgi:hypothetical protein
METFIKQQSYIIIDNDKFNSNYIELEVDSKKHLIFENDKMNGFFQIIYKSLSFHLDGITLETPWMYINKPLYKVNHNIDKSYIELSFKNIDHDTKIQQFFQIIQDIDKTLMANLNKKIKDKDKDIDSNININIMSVFSKNIRIGPANVTPFMKLKLNIIQKHVEFNNVKYKNVKHFLDSVDLVNSVAKCYIHCSGIWNYNGRFGTTWKIIAMKINKDDYDIPNPNVDESIEDDIIDPSIHISDFECEIDLDSSEDSY